MAGSPASQEPLAAWSRQNLALLLATKRELQRLAEVEVLIQEHHRSQQRPVGTAPPPPSVVQGLLLRYRLQGGYHLRQAQGFEPPAVDGSTQQLFLVKAPTALNDPPLRRLPLHSISGTNPLLDPHWDSVGRGEAAALAAFWREGGHRLTLSEAAAVAWRKQVALRWHELHGGEARQAQLWQLPVLMGVLCDAASIAHAQAMFAVHDAQELPAQSQQAQSAGAGVLLQAAAAQQPQQRPQLHPQAHAAAQVQQGGGSPRMQGGQGSGPESAWAAAVRALLPAPNCVAACPAGTGSNDGFMAACGAAEAAGSGSPAAAVPTPTLKAGSMPRLAVAAQHPWRQGEAALRQELLKEGMEEEGGQQGAWQQGQEGQRVSRLPGEGEPWQEEGAGGQGAWDHCQAAPSSPPYRRSYSSPLSLVSEEQPPQQQQQQQQQQQPQEQQQWDGWHPVEGAQEAAQGHQATALLEGGGWGASGQKERCASWHHPLNTHHGDDSQRQRGSIATHGPGQHAWAAAPHKRRPAAEEELGGEGEAALRASRFSPSPSPGTSPTAAAAGSEVGACWEDALPIGGSGGGSGGSGTGLLSGGGGIPTGSRGRVPSGGSCGPLLQPVLLRHFRPSLGKPAEEWGLTGREVSITGLPAGASELALRAMLEGVGASVVCISITRTGDPRGEVAYVELGSASQAVAVIEGLQGVELAGRRMFVRGNRREIERLHRCFPREAAAAQRALAAVAAGHERQMRAAQREEEQEQERERGRRDGGGRGRRQERRLTRSRSPLRSPRGRSRKSPTPTPTPSSSQSSPCSSLSRGRCGRRSRSRSRSPAGGRAGRRAGRRGRSSSKDGGRGRGGGCGPGSPHWDPILQLEVQCVGRLEEAGSGPLPLQQLLRGVRLPAELGTANQEGCLLRFLTRRPHLFRVEPASASAESSGGGSSRGSPMLQPATSSVMVSLAGGPHSGARPFLQYKRDLLQYLADHPPRVELRSLERAVRPPSGLPGEARSIKHLSSFLSAFLLDEVWQQRGAKGAYRDPSLHTVELAPFRAAPGGPSFRRICGCFRGHHAPACPDQQRCELPHAPPRVFQ